jgi:hypothetical protein
MSDLTLKPTENTEALLRELLDDPIYVNFLWEEKNAYGKFTGETLRSYVHEYFWYWVKSSLVDVDWDYLAEKINNE